jgi:hypothetical protein
MRVPDRRWAETNDDNCERTSRLADRLTRLAAGHPSADQADPGGLEPDDSAPGDSAPDDGAPDDSAPDDLEPGPVSPGDGVDRAPTAGFAPSGSVEPGTWHAGGAKDRSPYRPWFGADGASDPWFAEPTMDQPLTDQHAAAVTRETSRG